MKKLLVAALVLFSGIASAQWRCDDCVGVVGSEPPANKALAVQGTASGIPIPIVDSEGNTKWVYVLDSLGTIINPATEETAGSIDATATTINGHAKDIDDILTDAHADSIDALRGVIVDSSGNTIDPASESTLQSVLDKATTILTKITSIDDKAVTIDTGNISGIVDVNSVPDLSANSINAEAAPPVESISTYYEEVSAAGEEALVAGQASLKHRIIGYTITAYDGTARGKLHFTDTWNASTNHIDHFDLSHTGGNKEPVNEFSSLRSANANEPIYLLVDYLSNTFTTVGVSLKFKTE